jgi:hypothetical protein
VGDEDAGTPSRTRAIDGEVADAASAIGMVFDALGVQRWRGGHLGGITAAVEEGGTQRDHAVSQRIALVQAQHGHYQSYEDVPAHVPLYLGHAIMPGWR